MKRETYPSLVQAWLWSSLEYSWETTCLGEVGLRGSNIRKTNQAMWVSLYWRQESLVVINGIPEADCLVNILLLPRILWIFFFIMERFLFLIISLTSVVLWKKYSISAPLKIKIWKFYTEKIFSLGFWFQLLMWQLRVWAWDSTCLGVDHVYQHLRNSVPSVIEGRLILFPNSVDYCED